MSDGAVIQEPGVAAATCLSWRHTLGQGSLGVSPPGQLGALEMNLAHFLDAVLTGPSTETPLLHNHILEEDKSLFEHFPGTLLYHYTEIISNVTSPPTINSLKIGR